VLADRRRAARGLNAGGDGAARGDPDAVFVALGGGGLTAGIGGYIKAIGRRVEMVACSPENSADMHHSIAAAMRLVIGRHHTLIERAAGVAVAAYLKEKERYRGRRVVIFLCGANIGLDRLREILTTTAAS
jgi:threonine dehydratase